ncbi:MAG TPA: ABATE domain-containing protein [Mycobacteriales bacterium]
MGDVARIQRIGGHPAIDFVNTLGGLPERPDDEYVFTYADLLTWTEGSGLLDPHSAGALRHASELHPERAGEVLARALHLRDGLDTVLRSHLEGQPSRRPGLDIVRDEYAAAVSHSQLNWTAAAGYDWTWPVVGDADMLDQPLWPLAAEAVDLLRSIALDRLTRCGHCRWLFLDTSRNHSRRWCSMNACGAVMKMRRYRGTNRLQPPGS